MLDGGFAQKHPPEISADTILTYAANRERTPDQTDGLPSRPSITGKISRISRAASADPGLVRAGACGEKPPGDIGQPTRERRLPLSAAA